MKTEFSSALLRERYVKIPHRSGLTIYLFPKKLTTTYALLSAKYGSVDSEFYPVGEDFPVCVPDGVAHFLEHKLFENEDGSDSFAKFSEYGADANAYTTYNRTAYLFSCTDRFEESLRELLTFVTHPYFTPATVQKEQGIIAEEIRMYEDNPWERCFQNLLGALYEKNPVRKNICGSAESIARITPELLYGCYNTFYRLSNMALIVAGDVTEEQVLAVADEVLPDTAPAAGEIRRIPTTEKETVTRDRVECEMQVAKPLFCIGVKDPVLPADPSERLRREAAMTLLDEILFSVSGTFYNRLFEEGLLTPSFSSGYSSAETFAFHCISGESGTPETVLCRFEEYLDEVCRDGIPEEDFERCRRTLYADEIRAYDSTEEIANRLLSFAFEGGEMFSALPVYEEITREELNCLLRTSFPRERIAFSVVRPLSDGGEEESAREDTV